MKPICYFPRESSKKEKEKEKEKKKNKREEVKETNLIFNDLRDSLVRDLCPFATASLLSLECKLNK